MIKEKPLKVGDIMSNGNSDAASVVSGHSWGGESHRRPTDPERYNQIMAPRSSKKRQIIESRSKTPTNEEAKDAVKKNAKAEKQSKPKVVKNS